MKSSSIVKNRLNMYGFSFIQDPEYYKAWLNLAKEYEYKEKWEEAL